MLVLNGLPLKTISSCLLTALPLFLFCVSAQADELSHSKKSHSDRKQSEKNVYLGCGSSLKGLLDVWGDEFSRLLPRPNGEGKVAAASLARNSYAVSFRVRQIDGISEALTQLKAGEIEVVGFARDELVEATQERKLYRDERFELITVAIEPIALVVNRENDLDSLTLTEIQQIFREFQAENPSLDVNTSRVSRRLGSWGEVGKKGDWKKRKISPFLTSGDESVNKLISAQILKGVPGDFVERLSSAVSVVQAVSSDLGGIGFASAGAVTSGVRVVAIELPGDAAEQGSMVVPTGVVPTRVVPTRVVPSVNDVYSGRYPLTRYLALGILAPSKNQREVVEFIKFILSPAGQSVVEADGLIPLPLALREEQLRKIEAYSVP